MLISEDYFNNIEITDDVVSSTEQSNDSENPELLFDSMLSNYTHCISIQVSSSTFIFHQKEKKLWQKIIPQTIKRLNMLLDTYGIEHSEPLFIDDNVARIMGSEASNYKIIDHNHFKIAISSNDELTKEHLTDSLSLTIYINLPKLSTYKQAYKFIYNILRNIWKDNNWKELRTFNLLSASDSLEYIEKKLFIFINVFSFKGSIDKIMNPGTIYDILIYFFPDKAIKIWSMYDDAIMKRNKDLYYNIQ